MVIMINDLRKRAEEVFGGSVSTSGRPAKPFNREEHETKDRSKLAKALIYSFLAGIGIILLGVPLYNYFTAVDLRIDLFNILTAYSGILGPFVGVIAGYYFKN
jgi:polyferredoxin